VRSRPELGPPEPDEERPAADGDASMGRRFAALPWGRLRDQSIVAFVALILVGVLIWLIGHIIGIFALVAIAIVIALMLEPLLTLGERHMPRLLAAAGVYVVFLGVLAGLGFFLVPQFIHQGSQLVTRVPVYVAQADAFASREGRLVGLHVPPGAVSTMLGGLVQGSSTSTEKLGITLLTVAGQIAEVMGEVVLVLVLAFYLMIDGRRIRNAFARLFPARQRPKVRFVEETIGLVLGAYVRSQVVMAALMAASAGVGCLLLGVQYPAVIGFLAFFAELVPLVGPFLAAIPAMIIAVFQSFGLMVEVTFFFVLMQMAENNFIRPRITGPMVGLHPIEALLALVVGGVAAGFWGALFAVPAVGIAVVFGTVLNKAWRGQQLEFQRRGISVRVRSHEETAERERGP
jgi:predicted PurR-regulated permease PerM